MKTSYKTNAIAKQVATKLAKASGKEFVVVGPRDGEFMVKEVLFFPSAPVVKAKESRGIKIVKKTAPVAEVIAPVVVEPIVPVVIDYEVVAPVVDAPGVDVPEAPLAEVTHIKAKKTDTPDGVRTTSWKFIKAQLPELIEEVSVRHGKGKRYLLTVNGAVVWYAFGEATAKSAKAGILALKSA